jgi:hypothetical protein
MHHACTQPDVCECSGTDDECACIPNLLSHSLECRECGSPMVRSCIACGCTDDNACPGGCWWVSDEEACCSTCFEGARTLPPPAASP